MVAVDRLRAIKEMFLEQGKGPAAALVRGSVAALVILALRAELRQHLL